MSCSRSRSTSLCALSRQKSSFLCGGDHVSSPDASSDLYSSYVLCATLDTFISTGPTGVERERAEEARAGDAREAGKARLELVDEELYVVPDLVVRELAALERLDVGEDLGDEHGREVGLWGLGDEVAERGERDADHFFLDGALRDVEEERDEVVLPAGAGAHLVSLGAGGRPTASRQRESGRRRTR